MGIHVPLLMDAFSSKHIFVHIVGSKAVIQKLSLSTINVVVDFRISENCLLKHTFFTSFYQINMQSSILVLSLHSSCGFRCYWHCLLYNEHNTKWENSI